MRISTIHVLIALLKKTIYSTDCTIELIIALDATERTVASYLMLLLKTETNVPFVRSSLQRTQKERATPPRRAA
jgi:hypothetical protein